MPHIGAISPARMQLLTCSCFMKGFLSTLVKLSMSKNWVSLFFLSLVDKAMGCRMAEISFVHGKFIL